MGTYKNDYTKEEDYMMWELHRIRNKIAGKNLTADKINKLGRKAIEKYGLKNLRIVTDKEKVHK